MADLLAPLRDLADQIGVDAGDLAVVAEQEGWTPGEPLPDGVGPFLRDYFDCYHVRNPAVWGFWWPGTDPDAGSGATKMR